MGQPGQRQVIEEKIHTVNVYHVRLAHRLQDGWTQRVAAGTPVRQAGNRHIGHHILPLQSLIRVSEQPVQGDNRSCLPTRRELARGDVPDYIFHATNRWVVLPDDVNNVNAHASASLR